MCKHPSPFPPASSLPRCAGRTFSSTLNLTHVHVTGPLSGLNFQETTQRRLALELWGGDMLTVASGHNLTKLWLGKSKVDVTPLQCNAQLGTFTLTFGTSIGHPTGAFVVPPLDYGSIKLVSANNNAATTKATSQQIITYVQTLGTQVQAAALLKADNATLTWRYRPPLKIEVFIRPDGGCADDGDDCNELAKKCAQGADAEVRRRDCLHVPLCVVSGYTY